MNHSQTEEESHWSGRPRAFDRALLLLIIKSADGYARAPVPVIYCIAKVGLRFVHSLHDLPRISHREAHSRIVPGNIAQATGVTLYADNKA
jgi:hypothetical protein